MGGQDFSRRGWPHIIWRANHACRHGSSPVRLSRRLRMSIRRHSSVACSSQPVHVSLCHTAVCMSFLCDFCSQSVLALNATLWFIPVPHAQKTWLTFLVPTLFQCVPNAERVMSKTMKTVTIGSSARSVDPQRYFVPSVRRLMTANLALERQTAARTGPIASITELL